MIAPRRAALDQLEARLKSAMPMAVERARHRLNALEASLRALDPEAVLERGYAILRQEERIVSGVKGADKAIPLRVQLSDGELTADITAIAPKEK